MFFKSKRKDGWLLIETMCMCVALVLMLFVMTGISGCSVVDNDEGESIEYTVVEDKDLPEELKKLIDEKKESTLRLTYTTKEYTYLVAGYGKQETSGYSIRVDGVRLGNNVIHVNVSLIGPASNEQITALPTTPYIVIKIEKREESVIFSL